MATLRGDDGSAGGADYAPRVLDRAAQRYVGSLRHDLESGDWDKKYGHLRTASHYDGSLALGVG